MNNNIYFPLSYEEPMLYANGGYMMADPRDINWGQEGKNALSGGAKGASMGSAFGPIGMGVGAAVGAGASIFNTLGKKYAETKFGQSPFGKVAGVLANPIMGFSNLKQQKAIKAYEEQQAKLEEQRKEAFTDRNMSVVNSLMTPIGNSNLPMAMGGMMDSLEGQIGDFTSFENGGTHEQNPYGGIMLGENNTGRMVSVEEGESRFKFPEGDYIFSNRLTY